MELFQLGLHLCLGSQWLRSHPYTSARRLHPWCTLPCKLRVFVYTLCIRYYQGRRRATQGAEEKDKWVWQRRPPMWAAKLQQQGMGPWHEQEAPKGVEGGGTTEDVHAGKGHPEHSGRWDGRE